ncbi:DUF262 domain-containing protein [Hydrogenivirga sp. 128-5-R1-1]|uniref:DUF262 domain-containing protein n=1 Tax=Hydrogenivirga sp. 128-5-R1-1 TaxID=392423 RepID=UPI00015F1FFC|nr:DUF262 domain-containing protein [Hydrogenivirga sp. 128-5-R1-1]EDP74289.1 hypothetical protein HG1285_09316 [Hydrogenivirga sp. 128-5-R1-1]
MTESQKLTPKIFKISCLLNSEKKLEIPNFQRPYEWEEERIIQFLKDLDEVFKKEYLEKSNKDFEYLIGNMVFFEREGKYQIVDGQQRIVSLGIILYALGEKDNKFLGLKPKELSFNTIKRNYEVVKNFLESYQQEKNKFIGFIKNHLIVNALITEDLDFAFFLFDAHNTRGKPLDRKDLLKVHHIRLIKKEELKKDLAKTWENYEKDKEKETDKPIDKLKQILQILSVARKGIRGELKGDDLIESDVYKEFLSEDEGYMLNNYNQPPIFEDFEFDFKANVLRLKTKPLRTYSFTDIIDGYKYLPFEISQSIEGGERFFYFVIKYYHLIKELEEKHKNVFCLFDNISGSGNRFINALYKSLILLYYDKFEDKLLEDFAVRLIIIFSNLRLTLNQIRKETLINRYAKPESDEINLFRLIFLSYSPSIVKSKLDDYIRFHIESEIRTKEETIKIYFEKNEIKRINSKKTDDKQTIERTKGDFINYWLNSSLKEKIRETLKELGKNWEENQNE